MSEAFILIEKGNYLSRVWFMSKDGASYDVLMQLGRRLPDGDWVLQYRFRHYRDERAFDSVDERSYWTATFPAGISEAEAVRRVSPVIQKLKAMTRLDVQVASIESDEPRVVLHQLKQLRGMHMKVEERPS